jgi:hypothetical protein
MKYDTDISYSPNIQSDNRSQSVWINWSMRPPISYFSKELLCSSDWCPIFMIGVIYFRNVFLCACWKDMHKIFTDGEMTSFECQGCKVKSLGRRLCHNVSGKCQMVWSIDRIHRTSTFTVGQKFYRWWNDVIFKSRLPKVKSLSRRLCHNWSGKCQMVRLIGSIGQVCLWSDKNFNDGEITSF